ncbi:hypothetical protein [Clostridioides sp. ES-S-0048-02]|uniref:hypothetical protein n=1 Tax=Clostridioides sp. ES-S-0048-02 TaxID=2770777 RepID=UPI001D115331|nr:hypothetical protein [Clostridioides sp. ES-S-0048-02]
MNNYEKRERARTVISQVIKNHEWKLYGYNPSRMKIGSPEKPVWHGIAKKDDCILVVDKTSTNISNLPYSNYDDNGNCFDDIFPKYRFGNPPNYFWHIEYDGAILKMGKSLMSMCCVPLEFNIDRMEFEDGYEKLYRNTIFDYELKSINALKNFINQIEVTVKKSVEDVKNKKLIKVKDKKEILSYELEVIYGKEHLNEGDIISLDKIKYFKVTEILKDSYVLIKLVDQENGYRTSRSKYDRDFWYRKELDSKLKDGNILVYEVIKKVNIFEYDKWVKKSKNN